MDSIIRRWSLNGRIQSLGYAKEADNNIGEEGDGGDAVTAEDDLQCKAKGVIPPHIPTYPV